MNRSFIVIIALILLILGASIIVKVYERTSSDSHPTSHIVAQTLANQGFPSKIDSNQFLKSAYTRFNVSLSYGRYYTMGSGLFYAKRINKVVCIIGQRKGIHIIVNAHGVFLISQRRIYQLKLYQEIEKRINSLVSSGLLIPQFDANANIIVESLEAGTDNYIFSVKMPEDFLRREASAILDDLERRNPKSHMSLEVAIDLIPASQRFTVTLHGEIVRIDLLYRNGEMIPNRSMVMCSQPLPLFSTADRDFEDPSGRQVIVVSSYQELARAVRENESPERH